MCRSVQYALLLLSKYRIEIKTYGSVHKSSSFFHYLQSDPRIRHSEQAFKRTEGIGTFRAPSCCMLSSKVTSALLSLLLYCIRLPGLEGYAAFGVGVGEIKAFGCEEGGDTQREADSVRGEVRGH